MDLSFWALLGRLRNSVDFPIRQAVRWRRRGCRLPGEPKDDLFPPEALPEVERLVRSYHLEDWERQSGRTDFAASLFYLQMLERALRESGSRLPDGAVTALDAGCGDWFYVQGLYSLLRHYGTEQPRQVALDGVEVDAYQLYAGFYSRCDWALACAERCEGARYLPRDIRTYQRQVDVAFLLFPFLFARDLRRWGLPARYLRPAELLTHVWDLVKPGGLLLIANLGPAERAEQHRLLQEAGLQIVWWSVHVSPLFSYRQERYVTVVSRG